MSCPEANRERCALCQQLAPGGIEEMIEAGWYPCYYIGEVYQHGPVCGECCDNRLRLGEDGEYELIPPSGNDTS